MDIVQAVQSSIDAYTGKRWDEAEVLCRRSLSLAPSDPNLMLVLGLTLAELGHTAKGIDLVRRIAGLHPSHEVAAQAAADLAQRFGEGAARGGILYAYYDLALSLPTFDFITFLAIAASHCREKECNGMVVVFVPGPQDGFRHDPDYLANLYDNEVRRWRKKNILVPAPWLTPYCKGVVVAQDRDEARALYHGMRGARVFPETYHPDFPTREEKTGHLVNRVAQGHPIPSFAPSSHAVARVRQWLGARVDTYVQPVSITLRQTGYFTPRNSDIDAWLRFAHSLDGTAYVPIFVRDEEAAMDAVPEEMRGFLFFDEAVWNLELRAALYDQCYLNLACSTGPLNVAYHNHRCASLTFKVVTPGWNACTEGFFRRNGIEPGTQPVFLTDTHKYVWEDDGFEAIEREFRAMCTHLEGRNFVSGWRREGSA